MGLKSEIVRLLEDPDWSVLRDGRSVLLRPLTGPGGSYEITPARRGGYNLTYYPGNKDGIVGGVEIASEVTRHFAVTLAANVQKAITVSARE